MRDQLIILCRSCENFFHYHCTLQSSFHDIAEFLEKSGAVLKEIESFASEYDFDEKTPGNGFRSFLLVFDSAVDYTAKVCNDVREKSDKFLFSKSVAEKEIEACSQLIKNLLRIGEYLLEVHKIADNGVLFAKRCHHDNLITRAAHELNLESFYGRAGGFQYFESLRPITKFVRSAMASYSEFYYSQKNFVSKSFDLMTRSGKYFLDPEVCARRICNINKNADINFLSSFLKLSENPLLLSAVNVFGHNVEVSRVFEIRTDPMKIYSEKHRKLVSIPIPSCHIGRRPIQCRLISSKRREGMIGESSDCSRAKLAEPSKNLILFVHGGGWISQNSKLHEFYLREWSARLDTPVLAIDYSLAPEAPFPRAIDEIFYAYCWVLKNAELVGTTAENIVFVGDSAGANLVTAALIKCIEMGVRKPRGLFCAYGIFLVNLVKSPSRFMGFFDSFLPMGIVMKIFRFYGRAEPVHDPLFAERLQESLHTADDIEIPKATDEDYIYELSKDYLLSPYWAPDEILREFPPTNLLSMVTDPCLDDCIDFAKKLRGLNVDIRVDILDKLAHGFLVFTQVSKESYEASVVCMERIGQLLGLEFI